MCDLIYLCKDEGCPSRYNCKRFLVPYDERNTYFENLIRKNSEQKCRYFIKDTNFIYSFINKKKVKGEN